MTSHCVLIRRVCLSMIALGFATTCRAETPLPSDVPSKYDAPKSSYDYVKRVEMIPMRDGVKLYTVIVIPKGAKNAPILLTRTPYNASAQLSHAASSHLGPILSGYD